MDVKIFACSNDNTHRVHVEVKHFYGYMFTKYTRTYMVPSVQDAVKLLNQIIIDFAKVNCGVIKYNSEEVEWGMHLDNINLPCTIQCTTSPDNPSETVSRDGL